MSIKIKNSENAWSNVKNIMVKTLDGWKNVKKVMVKDSTNTWVNVYPTNSPIAPTPITPTSPNPYTPTPVAPTPVMVYDPKITSYSVSSYEPDPTKYNITLEFYYNGTYSIDATRGYVGSSLQYWTTGTLTSITFMGLSEGTYQLYLYGYNSATGVLNNVYSGVNITVPPVIATPTPTTPTPTTPTPITPTTPTPTTPTPTTPTPTTPTPITPTTPTPTTPTPITPTTPTPTTPTPFTPTPFTPIAPTPVTPASPTPVPFIPTPTPVPIAPVTPVAPTPVTPVAPTPVPVTPIVPTTPVPITPTPTSYQNWLYRRVGLDTTWSAYMSEYYATVPDMHPKIIAGGKLRITATNGFMVIDTTNPSGNSYYKTMAYSNPVLLVSNKVDDSYLLLPTANNRNVWRMNADHTPKDAFGYVLSHPIGAQNATATTDNDGNMYVVIHATSGAYNSFEKGVSVIKINISTNQIEWQKRMFGGVNVYGYPDWTWNPVINFDSTTNNIHFAVTTGNIGSMYAAWDKNGNEIYFKSFGVWPNQSGPDGLGHVGEYMFMRHQNLIFDSSGNVYITGYVDKSWWYNYNNYAYTYYEDRPLAPYALKLSPQGNIIWYGIFNNSGQKNRARSHSSTIDSNGNLYMTMMYNNSSPNATDEVGYLAKINSNGDLVYTRSFKSPGYTSRHTTDQIVLSQNELNMYISLSSISAVIKLPTDGSLMGTYILPLYGGGSITVVYGQDPYPQTYSKNSGWFALGGAGYWAYTTPNVTLSTTTTMPTIYADVNMTNTGIVAI